MGDMLLIMALAALFLAAPVGSLMKRTITLAPGAHVEVVSRTKGKDANGWWVRGVHGGPVRPQAWRLGHSRSRARRPANRGLRRGGAVGEWLAPGRVAVHGKRGDQRELVMSAREAWVGSATF